MKGRLLPLAFVSVLLVSSVGFGWEEPEQFLGLQWGASVEAVRHRFPEAVEATAIARERGKIADKRVRLLAVERAIVGDVDVTLMFEFFDDELVIGSLLFDPMNFSVMEEAFKERYGPPTAQETKTNKTEGGREYATKRLRWEGERIRIVLEQGGPDGTPGAALLGKKDYLKYMFERQKDRASKAATDL